MKRGLVILVVSVFVDIFGVALVIPMLPVWARNLGATPAQQGLLGTAYGACQLFGAILAGRISDTKGRKVVLLASLFLAGVSYLGTAFASSLTVLFLWRIPVGVGKQTISVASAYVSDSTLPENRSVWLAAVGSAAALGFVVGPALGGWLGAHDARLPAIVSASLFLVNFVCVWLFLPEPARVQVRSDSPPPSELPFVQSIVRALQTPLVGELLVVHFLFHMAFQLIKANFSLFNQERFSFGPQENGFLLAYLGVLSLLGKAGFVPLLSARFSDLALLSTNLLVLTVSLMAMAFSPNIVVYCLVLIPFTASTSIVGTVVLAQLSGAATGNVGALLGVASAFESITRILSPVICGALMQVSSGAPPFVGALVAAGAAAYVAYKKDQLRAREAKAKSE
jgi:DHA1 family tetracycline resistance protein-like MFS transporter